MKRPYIKKNKYLKDRTVELKAIAKDGTPWVFLCAASLIDYLSKLAEGEDKGRTGYKDFIKNIMSKVDIRYREFKYKNKEKDLPEQMYHVFRCGIVHSFSFIPDKRSKESGGRRRSIFIAHKFKEPHLKHLDSYSSGKIKDAVVFLAEDFIDDIEKSIDVMFKSSVLKSNLVKWWQKYPPILDEPDMPKR